LTAKGGQTGPVRMKLSPRKGGLGLGDEAAQGGKERTKRSMRHQERMRKKFGKQK